MGMSAWPGDNPRPMHDSIRQQLARRAERLSEIDFLLTRPDIMADMTQFMRLSREHTEVSAVVSRWQRYGQREADLAAAQALLQDAAQDAEMQQMAQEEISACQSELAQLEGETRMTSATPSWKSARARAATNRRCSQAIWPACTPATPKRRAGAWKW